MTELDTSETTKETEGGDSKPPPSPLSVGYWTKIALIAVLDSLLVWAIPTLAAQSSWFLLFVLVASGLAINWAYLSPRAKAAPWLTPGLILMALFVVWPIIYTAYVSLTNWSTGNVLTKTQAIERLEEVPLTEETQLTLELSVYRDQTGSLYYLVTTPDDISYFGPVRDRTAEPIEDGLIDLDSLGVAPGDHPDQINGFTKLGVQELFGIAGQMNQLILDIPDIGIAQATTTSQGRLSAGHRFIYDEEANTLFDLETGITCVEGVGTFLCDGKPLSQINQSYPGWRTVVGFEQFQRVLANRQIRSPLLKVFTWNLVFAGLSVLFTFSLGLILANALQDERLRGRAIYRSIFILPYAIPAFISIIVWRGLLNDQLGQVNRLVEWFGADGVPWLVSSNWAKVALLLVNTWLGFPYMFLIASGALQSIPEELKEAARTDGAGPIRVFRTITLPLMLVSTAPLLIGSFAYNFNNFVLIFLLTNGGPPVPNSSIPLGETDILITFTFDIALSSGRGQNFALASAIVILIFFIVAFISAMGFRMTKRLEQVYGD